MRTINQTPGTENQIVWLIRINMDDGTYVYFDDSPITLSGVTFSGSIISYGSMSDFGSDTDVLLGGGLGSMDHFNFAISRYTVYNDGTNTLQAFFNDWYPATGKPVLTSKEVDLGIVWNTGSATLSNVTWLKNYRISDYSYNTGNAFINCLEPDELSGVQVPRHKVQTKYDNGISYFPNAPEDIIDSPIPVLYGDFSTVNLEYSTHKLAPAIAVDKDKFTYLVCSHIVNDSTIYTRLFKYLSEPDVMLTLTGDTSSKVNARNGLKVQLSDDGTNIYGELIIQPKKTTLNVTSGGDAWDLTPLVTTPGGMYDSDVDTYGQLSPTTECALVMGSKLTTNDIGILSDVLTEVTFNVLWDSFSGANVNARVKYYHSTMGVNSGYSPLVANQSSSGSDNLIEYYFGAGAGIDTNWNTYKKKHTEGKPWSIEEIQELQFHIQNLGTSSTAMNIKNTYFRFQNIRMLILKEWGGNISMPFFDRRLNSQSMIDGLKRMADKNWIDSKNPIKAINASTSNIFASAKGYIYDNWIE